MNMMAKYAAIVNELDVDDWFRLFSRRRMIDASTCSKIWPGTVLKDMHPRDIVVIVGNCHG
jgi:hypothetical protein